MQRRMRAVGVTVVALVALAPVPAVAQASEDGWTVSRTPDGQPDLGGVWANNSVTPLERPDVWVGKTTLTDEDLAELKAAAAEVTASGLDAQFGDQLVQAALAGISDADSYDTTGNYNQFWLADRNFDHNRTSLIIDPTDGKIPPRTSDAERAGRGVPPPGERALPHVRRAEPVGRIQQLLSDPSESRPRRHSHGDDSRRAHHPNRRAAARGR